MMIEYITANLPRGDDFRCGICQRWLERKPVRARIRRGKVIDYMCANHPLHTCSVCGKRYDERDFVQVYKGDEAFACVHCYPRPDDWTGPYTMNEYRTEYDRIRDLYHTADREGERG